MPAVTAPVESIRDTVPSVSSATHVAPSPIAIPLGSLPTSIRETLPPSPIRTTAEALLATHVAPSPIAIGLGLLLSPARSPTATVSDYVPERRVDARGHPARRVDHPQLARVGGDAVDGIAERQRAYDPPRRRVDIRDRMVIGVDHPHPADARGDAVRRDTDRRLRDDPVRAADR